MSEEKPDTKQAGAALLAKEEPGAVPEPRASRGGARKGAGRPKKSTKKEEPKPITEAEIAAYAMVGGMVWKLAASWAHLEELTEEERWELGEAIAPVAEKYLPMLGDYVPEWSLALVVAGLVMKKLPKREKKESAIDDAGSVEE